MTILGKPDGSLFVHKIDFDNGKVTFTEDPNEGYEYPDTWKAGVELQMLQHNFKECEEQLKDMQVFCYYEGETPPWEQLEI